MARADKAIALHKAGQFQKAIALYRKLEPEARRSAEFWCLYGDALLRVNKTRQAADCFEKALTLSPGNPAALGPLSIALVTLKRYRDAEGVLRNLIARNSGDSIAKINLARVLVETNRPKEANETLGNVSKAGLGPSELAILLETRVDALLGEERYAEAISTTQEIVRTQSEKTQDRVAALRRLLNVATSARAGTITLSTLDALKAEGATEKFDAAQRETPFLGFTNRIRPITGTLWQWDSTQRRFEPGRPFCKRHCTCPISPCLKYTGPIMNTASWLPNNIEAKRQIRGPCASRRIMNL